MNVLHVLPVVAPRHGGPSAAIFPMCRALRSCGVDATIATTDLDGEGRLDVDVERVQPYDGVPTIFFSATRRAGLTQTAPLAAWIDRHVGRFDVVHVHEVFAHSSVAAARAAACHATPYIVQPHGTLDPWCLARKRLRKRMFLALAGSSMLRAAAAVQYTTDEEQRRAAAWPPARRAATVVPLGVPDESFGDPRPDVSAPYVLALCRLHPKKGLELLIRAFAALGDAAETSRWRLVIAGDGDARYVARLRQYAAQSGASARISFPGWVDGRRRHELHRAASLHALPSYQENFGLSIVEAMAAGVPVLAAPGVNLARDIEAAGAGWIADYDVEAVRDALRRAMTDAEERTRRAAAARRLAERFRWSAVAPLLAAAYRSAAAA